MKVRFPLVSKMVVLLVAYVALLPLLVFFILDTQYGFGWDAILRGPLGERADTVGRLVISQLRNSPKAQWSDELKTLGDNYHVQFYLFDFFGKQIAGESLELPVVLKERLAPPPMHHFERPESGGNPMRGGDLMRGWGPMRGGDPMRVGDPMRAGEPMRGRDPMRSGDPMRGGSPPPFGAPEFLGDGPPFGPMPFPALGDDRNSVMTYGAPPPPPLEMPHEHGKFIVHTDNPPRFFICMRLPMFVPGGAPPIFAQHAGPPIVTLVAASDNIWQNSLLFDVKAVLIAALSVLAFSALFWFPFIYRISKDLSELTVATERIAEGRFDTRLAVNRGDEVARLADAINSMSAKLSTFVTGQKRFLGDIAHELCSPIARLQMALELLTQRASADQNSQIADIREEVVEISNLVNELLAFSKAGLKANQPELKAIELLPVVIEVIDKLSAQALINVDVSPQIVVLADRLLIERALANVVRNSIRYASSYGMIEIKAQKLEANVVISVADHGPGVPEDSIAHLGEPFFRPAPARDRQSGGFGLGLAIVKSCIESCDGALVVANRKPTGLLVEFKLRLADGAKVSQDSSAPDMRTGQTA